MANKVIVYSCLSDKIRDAIDNGTSFAVMGEIIMFSSAIKTLRANGFNVVIVSSIEEFIKHDVRGVVYYILDYITIEHVKRIVLTNYKIHRVRFFCYWGRTINELPWTGPSGHKLQLHQVCTPFPYPNKPHNTFLGFLMPDLGGDIAPVTLFPSIHGYIWGKEEKYFDPGLIKQLGDVGIKFYATCTNNIQLNSSYSSVTNIGILSRQHYLSVIKHIKFVLGFGDPIAGPTIVETLKLGKILIAPRKQIPPFLHRHPNVVLLDDLLAGAGINGLINVIRDIEMGHKYVSTEGVPEYTNEQYAARVSAIFQRLPARRTCIIRSTIQDNNIFHFLALEIKTLWDFISRNNAVDYHVVLTHYNADSPAHRWRRALIEGLCKKVYDEASGSISAADYDNAIMDFNLQYKGPFLESFRYIDYPINNSLLEMSRHIKNYHLNVGWEADTPEGVLLIQRKVGSRLLCDAADGSPLENTLGEALKARGIPFKCCNFDTMSFYDQLRAVHSAKWIVAAHGAAETNIIFANTGATLIEINMRLHWWCDPVCTKHLSGEIPFEKKCNGGLKHHPTYHKADYHNLCKMLGCRYKEITPAGYKGRFLDTNPISKEIILVDCAQIVDAITTS
jgi:hypothetical protein